MILWSLPLDEITTATPDTTQFTYDETSGYYYDATTNLYYDASSQYFYNSEINQYMYWDHQKSTYVLAPSSSTDTSASNGSKTTSHDVRIRKMIKF